MEEEDRNSDRLEVSERCRSLLEVGWKVRAEDWNL